MGKLTEFVHFKCCKSQFNTNKKVSYKTTLLLHVHLPVYISSMTANLRTIIVSKVFEGQLFEANNVNFDTKPFKEEFGKEIYTILAFPWVNHSTWKLCNLTS